MTIRPTLPEITSAPRSYTTPQDAIPTRSVWEQSRHDWLELPEGLQHFMRGRDFDAKYQ